MPLPNAASPPLGNIAGDGPKCRDYVIEQGMLPPLIRFIENSQKIGMTRNATWALSNLCRGKNPPPNFEHVRICLPLLAKLLYSNDTDLLADTCWALSYLSDGPNEKIQAVMDTGVCRRLVELLAYVVSFRFVCRKCRQKIITTLLLEELVLTRLFPLQTRQSECSLCRPSRGRQHCHWRRQPDPGDP